MATGIITHNNRTKIGLECFISDESRRGGKYALATNPAAILGDGRPAWRAFMDLNLGPATLFGPEHGFRGAAQDAVEVEDEIFRGIPSYSLYGKRFKPEPAMLHGLDAVIYDMQDVGCRYYTFLYTLAYIMEACQENHVPLVVLDRPNPLGGMKVEGSPILDTNASFVGGYGLTPRYGMTIGEFALYLQGEYYPKVELEVVKLENWYREMAWFETGLPWPLPSPNIPSLSCAEVYPGTCLIEGTWFSEGRGTTRPFEIIGAPWIDGERLREELAIRWPIAASSVRAKSTSQMKPAQAQLALSPLHSSGVVFSSLFFSPTISKHKGENCEGILLNVVNTESFNSLNTGIAIVRTIKELWPKEFKFRETWEDPNAFFFDQLAGGPGLRSLIEKLAPLDECLGFVNKGRDQFLKRREKYLIYPDTNRGQSSM